MAVPTLASNTPSNGYIQWGAFSIQYFGVSYAIAAGNTNQRWVWWRWNGGAGASVIEAGADIPTNLTDDDLVLFGNRLGVGVRVQSTQTLDGDLLVDGSINADAIGANQITGVKIIAGAIDTTKMTANTINGDRIAANTLSADKIVANSIGAAQIAANAITANKLSIVVGGGNLLLNSGFEGGTGNSFTNWVPSGANVTLTAVTGWTGAGRAIRYTSTGAGNNGTDRLNGTMTGIPNGAPFTISYRYRRISGTGTLAVSVDSYAQSLATSGTLSTWDRVTASYVNTSGGTRGSMSFYLSVAGDVFEIDDVQVEIGDVATAYAPLTTEILPGTIIANMISAGAVTTAAMTANTIAGDRITANTLDAAKIIAGSITTTQMTANTINGDRITANTLDAVKIIAGSITTNQMTANTINGDRITANTLNASKIVADSITATQIAADAITTSELAANAVIAENVLAGVINTGHITSNTINGDRITANTLSADKIVANSITGTQISATALDAMTITGATIQTSGTVTRGVKITSAGFTAYSNGASATNQILNGSFDQSSGGTPPKPVNWTDFWPVGTSGSYQLDATQAVDGQYALKVTCPVATGGNTNSGLNILSDGFAVTGGTTLTIRALSKTDNAAQGKLALGLFYSADSTATNPGFYDNKSTLVQGINGVRDLTTGYVQYTATITVPAGSVRGAILLSTYSANGTALNIWHDQVTVTLPGAAAAGSPTFAVDGTTGAVTVQGSITSGSTITGAIIQGGVVVGTTIQTAASGERLVFRNDGSGGIIESYSGLTNESPGVFDPSAFNGTAPALTIQPGRTPASTRRPTLQMYSYPDGYNGNAAGNTDAGGYLFLGADVLSMSASAGEANITGKPLRLASTSTIDPLRIYSSQDVYVTANNFFRAGGPTGNVHVITSIYDFDWTAIPFWDANWNHYNNMIGGNWQTCQWRRIGYEVELRGLAYTGVNRPAPFNVAVLPANRPPLNRMYTVQLNNVPVRIDALINGQIQVAANSATAGSYLSLDGIRFQTT